MVYRLAGLLWIAALLAGCTRDRTPQPPAYPRLVEVTTPAAALERVLASRPLVLAVGEYHQTEATARVASAVKRFSDQMLPALAGRAGDLVLETWVASGRCGQAEQRATAEIDQTTQRPEATEDELLGLLARAKAEGIRPHVLELTCADYEHIQPEGRVDYHRVLALTRDKLLAEARAALAKSAGHSLVVVYGGAVHNDLHPPAGEEEYSYGPAVEQTSAGRVVELDLLVPAFVDEDVIRAQDWYPLYRRAVASGRLSLIERGPRAYALVFAN